MSVDAVRWVIENSKSKGTTRCVLIALAWHAGRDGTNAWPCVETLGREANADRRTIQRALRWAEEHGEIEPTGLGRNGTTVYSFPSVRGGGNLPPNAGCGNSAPEGRQSAAGGAANATSRGGSLPPKRSGNVKERSQENNGFSPAAGSSPRDVADDAEAIAANYAVDLEAHGMPPSGESPETMLRHARTIAELAADPFELEEVLRQALAHPFWASRVTTLGDLAHNYRKLRAAFVTAAPRSECVGCDTEPLVSDLDDEGRCPDCRREIARRERETLAEAERQAEENKARRAATQTATVAAGNGHVDDDDIPW